MTYALSYAIERGKEQHIWWQQFNGRKSACVVRYEHIPAMMAGQLDHILMEQTIEAGTYFETIAVSIVESGEG